MEARQERARDECLVKLRWCIQTSSCTVMHYWSKKVLNHMENKRYILTVSEILYGIATGHLKGKATLMTVPMADLVILLNGLVACVQSTVVRDIASGIVKQTRLSQSVMDTAILVSIWAISNTDRLDCSKMDLVGLCGTILTLLLEIQNKSEHKRLVIEALQDLMLYHTVVMRLVDDPENQNIKEDLFQNALELWNYHYNESLPLLISKSNVLKPERYTASLASFVSQACAPPGSTTLAIDEEQSHGAIRNVCLVLGRRGKPAQLTAFAQENTELYTSLLQVFHIIMM